MNDTAYSLLSNTSVVVFISEKKIYCLYFTEVFLFLEDIIYFASINFTNTEKFTDEKNSQLQKSYGQEKWKAINA